MGMNRILNGLAGLTGAGDPELQSPQQPASIAEPVTENTATLKRSDQRMYANYQRHKVESMWASRQNQPSPSTNHEESPLLQALREIGPATVARRDILNHVVTIELPKPAAEMSQEDYEIAYLRTMFRTSGLTDATDSEILTFQHDLKQATGAQFGLHATLDNLRAAQGDTTRLQAATSDWSIAVVDAGKRDIYRQRQEQTAHSEELRQASQVYGEEALVGFYKVQGNGALNLVNDATKIVGLPEIPKFEIRGEYWQNKKGVAETATTITAGVMTGGAGLAGDLLVISSSAGNMAEAGVGVDLRTGEQLSTTERAIRGGTGLIGAYSVRSRVDEITGKMVESVEVKLPKPLGETIEAATPEGVRMPVSTADDALTATNFESRTVKDINGRRGLETHEMAGGHTIEKHIGKSENWLRKRLESDLDIGDFASSFRNEAAANRAQGQFVKQHRAEIDTWLAGDKAVFKPTVDLGEPLGIVVERGKSGHTITTKAFFMLVRDNSPQGWHFVTSYPVK